MLLDETIHLMDIREEAELGVECSLLWPVLSTFRKTKLCDKEEGERLKRAKTKTQMSG